jgi:hypothetical protein
MKVVLYLFAWLTALASASIVSNMPGLKISLFSPSKLNDKNINY